NVILSREVVPGRLYLSVTDVHGYFRFESIPEGSWSLGVVRDGVVPEIKTGILVKPPARAVVDIVLKKSAARLDPPVFDLARFDAPAAGGEGRGQGSGSDHPSRGVGPSTAPLSGPTPVGG